MTEILNSVVLPGWWQEALLQQNEDGSGPVIRPRMHMHELHNLAWVLGFLQKRIIHSGQSEIMRIRFSEFVSQTPRLSESAQFTCERLFFMLPSFTAFKNSQELVGFSGRTISAEEVEVAPHTSWNEPLFGFSQALIKTANHYESGLAPLEINTEHLFALTVPELQVLLVLFQSKETQVSYSDFSEIFAGVDRLHETVQSAVESIGRRGIIETFDFFQSSFEFSWSREFLGSASVQIGRFSGLARNDFLNLNLTIASDNAQPILTDEFKTQVRKFSEWVEAREDFHEGYCVWSGGRYAHVSSIFVEWCFRNSPLHKRPLPNQILNSLFGDLCYLDHENLFENYLRFAEIVKRDRIVQKFLDSQYGRKSRKLVKSPSESFRSKATPVPEPAVEPKKVSEISNTQVIKTAENKDIVDQATAEDIKSNRLNAKNLVSKELTVMKKHKPDAYKKLKFSYVKSLKESEQEMLLQLENQLSREVFESQITSRLIRYMMSNPGKWESSVTRLY